MKFKTKTQKREELRINENIRIREEHERIVVEHAMMLDFIHLAAASKKSGGTYSNCRKALEQKSKEILDKLNY